MSKYRDCLSGVFTFLFLLAVIMQPTNTDACTGLTVKSKDGGIVFVRSLEFGVDLKSSIAIIPRNYSFTGTAPDKNPGLQWEVKYGTVGATEFDTELLVDGINEKGLQAGIFFFPNVAKYQTVTSDEYKNTIAPWELATWLLTRFATVPEALEGVKTIKVTGTDWDKLDMPMELHFIISDTNGDSAVIEYVNGELNIYNNPLGVITNAPAFDWQLTNLQNYANLSPMAAEGKTYAGMKINPTGMGSGMYGLPGDATPPSRFVRAALFSQNAYPVDTAEEAVQQAVRLINSFYLIAGVNRDNNNGKVVTDITEWQTISDLKNLSYYFATYENPATLNKVDLKEIDFDAEKVKRISMDQETLFNDVTSQAK